MKSASGAGAPRRDGADAPRANEPRVCLTMIVKDEAHVMQRCLESVALVVDSYLIADTGSTDGTPEKIVEVAAKLGIPGRVLHHAWKDYGANRTMVFDVLRAEPERADYALMIDADDVLEVRDVEAFRASLRAGRGALDVHVGWASDRDGAIWHRPQVFRMDLPWRYERSYHELATCDVPFDRDFAKGVAYWCHRDGGRQADPEKLAKEIALLQGQLEERPGDPRATYYLHQLYYENLDEPGFRALAEEWGRRVIEGEGWHEERFMAALRLGDLLEREGSFDVAQGMFLRAMGLSWGRVEPYARLARMHRLRAAYGWANVAYVLAKVGSQVRLDPRALLAERATAAYAIWEELTIAAYASTRYADAVAAAERVLASGAPDDYRRRALENLRLARSRMKQEPLAGVATVPANRFQRRAIDAKKRKEKR